MGSRSDAPLWILRHHSPSPIHALRLVQLKHHDEGKSAAFILAGDSQGRVSFSSLNDVRPRYFWKAHEKGVLGVDIIELDGKLAILSQGRDNKLHAHQIQLSNITSLAVLPSRIQDDLTVPDLIWSLDVNALNYCPMSVLHTPQSRQTGPLVAIPHTLDSGFIDVIQLSPEERIARAVGQADIQSNGSRAQRAPMCMSMQLLGPKSGEEGLRIIAGYEDGYMRSWSLRQDGSSDLEWESRKHNESIMSSACSQDRAFAVSVGADDIIALYTLYQKYQRAKITKSRAMGHASVAIRKDGKLIAVGGWDGNVRLFDNDLQHSASLRYHKDTVQAVAFAETSSIEMKATRKEEDDIDNVDDEDDDEINTNGVLGSKTNIDNLLITGGKEGRICIWST
ncbi:WD40 repeat-like protein [Meira miltonrushii]|uniref:ASTRA-associated protein 1 n=1 Tax=Meira miltonrushii TaxID=1280837 RepID=A0A316VKW0_9BASI|nr:WD40 repeat-like protein [Meira miltonrushii]PWN36993.1 WD40 repeat-like protein [Meira miltonrushii]